jgi:GNAT superfamily N-acetyltransferase
MHRVRLSVRQNRLTSRIVSEADYIAAIEETGRGWVVEHEGCVVGFAVGNSRSGNIWALFVDPDYEGHGYGRELHTAMTSWLWSRGLEWLWLTTEPGTRAERFYRAAGWIDAGRTESGEIRLELSRPVKGDRAKSARSEL